MEFRYLPPSFAALATAGLGLLLAWLTADATAVTWQDMPLSKAGLTYEYCELNQMEAFIRQPVNAWSNLIYFFLGSWILVVAVTDARRKVDLNPLTRFPWMSMWLGLMLMGLCFGSFFFHASVTQLGQHWDMGFTYAVALGLMAGAGYRLALLLGRRENNALKLLFLMATIAVSVVFYLIKWYLNGKIVLPLLMLTGVGLAIAVFFKRRAAMETWRLLAGILMLVLALIFRTLDVAKVGCDAQGWLQLHAAWHACTGLSAFLFWTLLHSEKP